MSAIPRINVLDSISPFNIGTGDDELGYNKLLDNVFKYRETHALRRAEVEKYEPGSIEELDAVRQLAMEDFVNTSAHLIATADGSRERDIWAKRFTAASIKLYGAPERDEVIRLLFNELEFLHQIDGGDDFDQEKVVFLGSSYEQALKGFDKPVTEEDSSYVTEAIRRYGDVLRSRYGYIFDLVDASHKQTYSPKDLEELFQKALDRLSIVEGGAWKDWHPKILKNKTIISVNADEQIVSIGAKRPPVPRTEAKALLAHELFVHVLRSKNGYQAGDDELALGIGGFLDTEEGMGLLSEYAITGDLPNKAKDRYMDIGLALGVVGGRQVSRRELFKMCHAREVLRRQATYTYQTPNHDFETKVWSHVDRIFRGTPGDDDSKILGVFTKDTSYHKGYREITDYLSYQVEQGHDMTEVFDYIMQGKFDPTDKLHREYVARHSKITES